MSPDYPPPLYVPYLRSRDDGAIRCHSKVGAVYEGHVFPHGDRRAGQDVGEVEAVAHVLQ